MLFSISQHPMPKKIIEVGSDVTMDPQGPQVQGPRGRKPKI